MAPSLHDIHMAEAGNTTAIFSPHFFLFTARPHQQPTLPHTEAGGHLSAFHPVSPERCLPPLPVGQGPGPAGKCCLHPMSIYAAGELLCLWKTQAEKGEWGIQYHLLTPPGSKSVLHKFWYAAQKYLIYCIKKKKKKEMYSCLTLLKTAGRTQ